MKTFEFGRSKLFVFYTVLQICCAWLQVVCQAGFRNKTIKLHCIIYREMHTLYDMLDVICAVGVCALDDTLHSQSLV
jgi:hypothetical protein